MNRKGFTLIELLVVIAIIGLLSTMAIVALGTARMKSRDARRVADLKQIQTALEMYNNDTGAYPTSTFVIGDSTHACLNSSGFQAAGCPNPYLAKLPKDPDKNFYIYSGTGNTYTVAAMLENSVANLSGQIGVSQNSGLAPATALGINLVTNGFGYMNNNNNFSSFTFDTSDVYVGGGSFKKGNFQGTTDEFIPVDPTKNYRASFWAKSTTHVNGSSAYLGESPYDIDKLNISPIYYLRMGGTDTTLAQAINPGDTVVRLTSAANWQTSELAYQRQIIIFNYTNSQGYTYPPYTYSRNHTYNITSYRTNGAWATGGISGNNITLTSAWPASLGTIPAGTAVSNGNDGNSFKYTAASNVDIPAVWTNYTGVIGGYDVAGNGDAGFFPYGTAFVKMLFLLDYTTIGNVTNVSDVRFYQTQ